MPPEDIGNGTSESEMSNEPEEVIDLVEHVRKVGSEMLILVTVPFVCSIHVNSDPLDDRICPTGPKLVKPVPPEEIGIGVPDREISKDPDWVMVVVGQERNDGNERETSVIVPLVCSIHV